MLVLLASDLNLDQKSQSNEPMSLESEPSIKFCAAEKPVPSFLWFFGPKIKRGEKFQICAENLNVLDDTSS